MKMTLAELNLLHRLLLEKIDRGDDEYNYIKSHSDDYEKLQAIQHDRAFGDYHHAYVLLRKLEDAEFAEV